LKLEPAGFVSGPRVGRKRREHAGGAVGAGRISAERFGLVFQTEKFSCEPPKPTRWLKVPNEPPSSVAVTFGGPDPCLVVIAMTPPIASEP
jgi:hypothetical protein